MKSRGFFRLIWTTHYCRPNGLTVENRPENFKQKMEKKAESISQSKRTLLAREISRYDCIAVTGATSGIGRGFAELIDSLANVKLCNISRTFPSYLKDRKDFLNVPCDLKNSEEISEAVKKVLDFANADRPADAPAPRILLINNSGFGAYGEFPAPSTERNCDMVDLNARAVVQLCGEMKTAIVAGKGSIINIASTAAFQPCPNLTVYAATKSFVMSFTLGMGYELRKHGCKCLCVAPGPTSSNFFKAAGFDTPPLPSGFGHKPFDVAYAALEALAKNKSLKVVGKLNKLQTVAVKFIPLGLLTHISGLILSKIRTLK